MPQRKAGSIPPLDDHALIVALGPALQSKPDEIRWGMPLVEVLGYRHAQLWSAGHRIQRAIGAGARRARQRKRAEELRERYGSRR